MFFQLRLLGHGRRMTKGYFQPLGHTLLTSGTKVRRNKDSQTEQQMRFSSLEVFYFEVHFYCTRCRCLNIPTYCRNSRIVHRKFTLPPKQQSFISSNQFICTDLFLVQLFGRLQEQMCPASSLVEHRTTHAAGGRVWKLCTYGNWSDDEQSPPQTERTVLGSAECQNKSTEQTSCDVNTRRHVLLSSDMDSVLQARHCLRCMWRAWCWWMDELITQRHINTPAWCGGVWGWQGVSSHDPLLSDQRENTKCPFLMTAWMLIPSDTPCT